MFNENTDNTTTTSRVHPCDMVMDAFKDPERSKLSVEKMFNFLTEAMTIHGKKLVHAPMPVA